MSNAERAHAHARQAAGLGLGGGLIESARIVGQFDAVLKRAKPQHEAEHHDLIARLVALNTLVRTPRSHTDPRLTAWLREIGEIERHLQTLAEVEREFSYPNVVTTVGKNFLLDNGLAGSAYTAAFFLGLISSVSYTTGPAAGDTMGSHGGWTESGATNAPTYSGSRKTAAWSSAASGSKALSAGLVFTFTGAGTVRGSFLTTVSTVDGTTGTLYSAGLFTGGDQPVVSTNTLTVSYTASL